MEEPITDSETMSEGPQSFDPISSERESQLTVDIVHYNGTTTVKDFTHIEELDAAGGYVRVWYDGVHGDDYETYYGATITQVNP